MQLQIAASENLDGRSVRDRISHPVHIPVRQTNTSMAGRAPDHVRIIGPVNANSFFVQANPGDADRISRARWML